MGGICVNTLPGHHTAPPSITVTDSENTLGERSSNTSNYFYLFIAQKAILRLSNLRELRQESPPAP